MQEIKANVADFMSSADFVVHTCVFSDDVTLLFEIDGQTGAVIYIEEIRSSLHALAMSYPVGLKRIFVEDLSHIVVLFRLQDSRNLIVVASKEAPLGAVAMSVGKLAARLG